MTALRQRMIEAMQQRGFSPRTHQSYLAAVTDLARYSHLSPDRLRPPQIQAYFTYLINERQLSAASCKLTLSALRFLYLQVLHWQAFDIPIPLPRKPQRIPELLTRQEIQRLILACHNPKHRLMLLTCYGCGLRIGELIALKVRHIDGERRLLRIEQGKGAKDRLVVIPDTLLQHLRHYWHTDHPGEWLFPNGNDPNRHLSPSSARKIFHDAKDKAGIHKVGGIHSLRHAYATHQLADGLALQDLQQQLGHKHLRATLQYIHWIALSHGGSRPVSDLLNALNIDHD